MGEEQFKRDFPGLYACWLRRKTINSPVEMYGWSIKAGAVRRLELMRREHEAIVYYRSRFKLDKQKETIIQISYN